MVNAGAVYCMNDYNNFEWWTNNDENTPNFDKAPVWYPPKVPDLLEEVHKKNVTHIKSPFHHLRYPHEFKNKEYYKYNECVDEEPTDSPKEPVSEPFSPTQETRNLNVQLQAPRRRVQTYREYFDKKSLRKRIYDGEIAFYDDFVEMEIARDYCRIFDKPFNVPRHDWGGENYFFGEKIVDEALETQEEDEIPVASEPSSRTEVEPVAPKLKECDLKIMSSTNLSETKKRELLKGEIPSLFSTQGEFVKKKKDKWISFHNLRTYAYMIDSVTRCPPLHVQMQNILQTGWKSQSKNSFYYEDSTSSETFQDPYSLTKEQIEQANSILKERKNPVSDEIPDVNKLVKIKKYSINENCSTVGGGRYQI
ncbi:conserved hypothetical protein [Theileria equi strain WA]|uniref:Uncharacterized protein n=1 Tax=Theileria equi strain WA TaxID=1537102 RepID=L1LCC9_THEEQ|nr:conserved hypothetical protein [Theileria equi strain WA]EKX72934.1 conserved hypothetical protein [Theileria equi strain WA]|eukprot:XP_004832386.1 conserved hypothetical protein [Theileria equi strain WA]